MTTIQPNFTALSADRQSLVGCYNRSSAIAYFTGRLPNKVETEIETTVSVQAFVSPSGQYYVQHGNQRLDVANVQTARYYLKNGVPVSVLLSASLAQLNQ